jgi:hypothetical protein
MSKEQAAIPSGCTGWLLRAAMDVAAECANATWQPPRISDFGLYFFIAPIMKGAKFDWV